MADNNNNYSNFNGYQQPQPVQPIYIQPDMSAQQRQADEKAATTWGIWSIVCSTLLCCCCGIGPILGFIFSLVGLKKQKGNVLCIVGLIISILAFALFAVNTVTNIANTDWNAINSQYQEIMDQYGQEYSQNGGQEFDLNDVFGAIFRF